MDLSRVSIGLPGATPHPVIEALAPQIEAAGFREVDRWRSTNLVVVLYERV